MTAEDRYQVGRRGQGFEGPGQAWLGNALDLVRAKLKGMQGPFTIQVKGEESFPRNRQQTIARMHELAPNLAFGTKIIVDGAAFDEPGVIFRRIKDEPDESPLVTRCREYLGLPYVFGQAPSLNPRRGGDCSGTFEVVVKHVMGFEMPQPARAQWVNPHMHHGDRDDIESGWAVVYSYPRDDLPAGSISHIAFVIDGNTEIGSRPSTDGIGICNIDWPWVAGFGRVA